MDKLSILMKTILKYKYHIIIFLLVATSGSVLAIGLNKYNERKDEVAKEDIGKVFPMDVSLAKMQFFEFKTEAERTQEVLDGNVLVAYLVPGCEACRREAKLMAENRLNELNGLKIFGIVPGNKKSVEKFVKDHDLNFPILADKNGEIRQKFEISLVPTNLFVQNGVVTSKWYGAPKDVNELLSKMNLKFEKLHVTQ